MVYTRTYQPVQHMRKWRAHHVKEFAHDLAMKGESGIGNGDGPQGVNRKQALLLPSEDLQGHRVPDSALLTPTDRL